MGTLLQQPWETNTKNIWAERTAGVKALGLGVCQNIGGTAKKAVCQERYKSGEQGVKDEETEAGGADQATLRSVPLLFNIEKAIRGL